MFAFVILDTTGKSLCTELPLAVSSCAPIALAVRWHYSSHSSHLLSLPSHCALSCSFNLLPLYQANPTGCLSKYNKRHGYKLGSTVKTTNQTPPNLCFGPACPSCLHTIITQDKANTSKLTSSIGHCAHRWGRSWPLHACHCSGTFFSSLKDSNFGTILTSIVNLLVSECCNVTFSVTGIEQHACHT